MRKRNTIIKETYTRDRNFQRTDKSTEMNYELRTENVDENFIRKKNRIFIETADVQMCTAIMHVLLPR